MNEIFNVNENSFEWEYESDLSKKKYEIKKHGNMEPSLIVHQDVKSTIEIALWKKNDEGIYEFYSIGSRLFDLINDDDIRKVWNAITKMDIFLNNEENKK